MYTHKEMYLFIAKTVNVYILSMMLTNDFFSWKQKKTFSVFLDFLFERNINHDGFEKVNKNEIIYCVEMFMASFIYD